jgi:DNA-directed RNA polymerase subunit RPC12/RpoP
MARIEGLLKEFHSASWYHNDGAVEIFWGQLRAAIRELVNDLDEASPMQKCARCGKEDRQHRLIWEEGDEMECHQCWERCNAQERAAIESVRQGKL